MEDFMKSVFNKALIIALCLSISGVCFGGICAQDSIPLYKDTPSTRAQAVPVVNPSVVNPSVVNPVVVNPLVQTISRPVVQQGWFSRTYERVTNSVDQGFDNVINWLSANRKKAYAAVFLANIALKIENETGDISRGMAQAGHACSQAVKNFGTKSFNTASAVGSQFKNIFGAGMGNIASLASAVKNNGKAVWVNHPYLCVGGVLGLYGLTLAVMMRRARIREQRQAELADLSFSEDEQETYMFNDGLYMRLSRRTSKSQPVVSENVDRSETLPMNVAQEVASENIHVAETLPMNAAQEVAADESGAVDNKEQAPDSDGFYDAQESFLTPSNS
jgi:hypothetical protein